MLVDGLSWASGWRSPWSVPTKGALAQARGRLGPEPLQALFEQVAVPLATPQTAGGFYRELRLVTIDGTCIDVADSPANAERFGRPGSGRGEGSVGFRSCGWWRWRSAPRTRSRAWRWGRARPVSWRSRTGCGVRSARACCVWLIATSTASSASRRPVRPGRSCSGG